MNVERRFVGRWGRVASGILIGVATAACSLQPSARSPRQMPIRLESDRPVLISKDELDRYRCASDGIMHCHGSTSLRSCMCLSAGPAL